MPCGSCSPRRGPTRETLLYLSLQARAPDDTIGLLHSFSSLHRHDNGTIISDAMFYQTRKNQLERHAKRGFMSRMKAEGLKAFVKVLPTHVRLALFLLSLIRLDSNVC